ncbi:MAG: DUF2062 domain-containing protein [Dictyoglomaceae bacterium]|nr:DUF2062 domain-containing protein [Dictyoglomaceae bacterium]
MKRKRNFKRFFRLIYLKIIRINDSPEKIAKSFAVGVFIGIFPTFGIGGVLALILAKILKLNYLASVLGTFIMNYFTSPIFWSLSYFLGSLILEGKINFKFIGEREVKYFALNYIVGNIIIAILVSFLSYFIIKEIIVKYKEKKKRRGEKPLLNDKFIY